MSRLLKYIFSFYLVLFIQTISFSQNDKYHSAIPDVPSSPALVNDLAHMLSAEEVLQLESKLETFNNETSNEIAIVTIDTLGGLEVAEFANELGRKWDIGKADKRNGVLLLVSKKDRQINISPGDKLQGALPDVLCGKIIREDIVPNFRSGNYYQAFDDATDKIIAATKGEFTNDSVPESGGSSILFFVLLFMLVLFLFFYFNRNKSVYISRRGYHSDDDNWTPRGGGLFGGGGFGGFSGGGSSGGGFGGFGGGGGGFDGGGASGSW